MKKKKYEAFSYTKFNPPKAYLPQFEIENKNLKMAQP